MVGAFGHLDCLQDYKPKPELEGCTKFPYSFYMPRPSHQSDNITEE